MLPPLSTSQPRTLQRVFSTRLPTRWGVLETLGFERAGADDGRPIETAIVMVLGDLTAAAPLLRIHSQCFTSEMLGSLRCDCQNQLEMALRQIAEEGRGLVIYEHQEGRGIGLMAKLQAYALQDAGRDTLEANHALGYLADYRDFSFPAAILQKLDIRQVRLLTNNPQKIRALSDAGIDVIARIPCEVAPTTDSIRYLRTKREKMGHLLTLARQNAFDDDAEAFPFATIKAAIGELQASRMIVVVDDEDRENEGDLVMAAEMVTPGAINFMATHARGLICLAMTGERLDQLGLAPMVPDNRALHGTAFTVSIDVMGEEVSTGISAHDRAATIRAAVDLDRSADEFATPGHVFPLRARAGGVLERRGQTEAAVDIAGLAGLQPAGVICEIVNDDGTMARIPDLVRFCRQHGLLMITVADLARYRLDMDHASTLETIEMSAMYGGCLA